MSYSISACITSYNRFDLLQKSLDSFLTINTIPIDKIILIEDGSNINMQSLILAKYGNQIEFIFNNHHLGQIKSIDKMYNQVNTDYILHIEDDFIFDSNPNFIKDGIDLLQENPYIHQIWLRHLNDIIRTHTNLFIQTSIEDKILYTSTSVPYKMMKPIIMGNWHGFSFQTHIKRTSDYRRMFPNGYQEHIKNGEVSSLAESIIDLAAGIMGYRAAILVNGCGIDGGQGRNS